MNNGLKRPSYASTRVDHDGRVHVRLRPVLHAVPTLAVLALWSALFGACGQSVYPSASNASPTATITTSPTAGNFLYSSNFADGKVAVFSRDLATGALALTGSPGAGSVNGPIGIANGPSAKYLYVVNSADGNVREFGINSSTGALTALSGSPIAAGGSPQWIAVTPNSKFAFVANNGDGSISPYTVKTSTGVLSANGPAFSPALLMRPVAAVASNNWLYVTDANKGTIVSFPIGANGTLSAGTATALGGTASPGVAVIDPTGNFVYVSDQAAGLVYYLTVGTGILTLAALPYTSSVAAEGGLALGTSSLGNEFLFVANESASPPSISVFFVNPGGTLGLPVQYFDATLNLPTGVAVDPTGSFLYVANQGNGTISRFTIDPTTGALGAGLAFATESASSAPLFLALGQ